MSLDRGENGKKGSKFKAKKLQPSASVSSASRSKSPVPIATRIRSESIARPCPVNQSRSPNHENTPSFAIEPVKWPPECVVLDEKIRHICCNPMMSEPYYTRTGKEDKPKLAGDPTAAVIYKYCPKATIYFNKYDVSFPSGTHTVPQPDSLQFESRFESGNLGKVIRVASNEYELYLRPDLYTNRHMEWFYFRVTNMKKATTYRFSIVNFTKDASLYKDGMKPLLYSTKDAQMRRIGWRRCGENINYFNNGVSEKAYGDYTYTLTFTLKFPNDKDVAYLAYSYPYTYSNLQEYLLQLSKNLSKAIFTTISPLCKTVAGNNVYCITITSPQTSDEIKKKRAVIVTARVHPGEAPASWMMKGFIDFLTGQSLYAKKLRDKYIFKLVPMLNPDGVIVGNNRCSLKRCDLNREYITATRNAHPTIWYTKAMIKSTLEECGVAMYCDLHAHAVKHNIFVYGCENGRLLDRPEDQVFPMMLQKNASDKFSFESCEFGIQYMKEGAGRIFMWRMGILNSYTLEASFGGSLLNNRAKTHFKIRDYEQMGHTFCQTLLNFPQDDIKKKPLSIQLVERVFKEERNTDKPPSIQLSDYSRENESKNSSNGVLITAKKPNKAVHQGNLYQKHLSPQLVEKIFKEEYSPDRSASIQLSDYSRESESKNSSNGVPITAKKQNKAVHQGNLYQKRLSPQLVEKLFKEECSPDRPASIQVSNYSRKSESKNSSNGVPIPAKKRNKAEHQRNLYQKRLSPQLVEKLFKEECSPDRSASIQLSNYSRIPSDCSNNLNQPGFTTEPVKWPPECVVVDEKIKHIYYNPMTSEPYYRRTGIEDKPKLVGDRIGTVIYNSCFKDTSYFNKYDVSTSTDMPTVLERDSLQFESRFESGNLSKVIRVATNAYELHIRPDLYTNRQHMEWFYFRVTNMRTATTYRFSIVNFTKHASLYIDGMKPLLYSTTDAQMRKIGWRRCGENINYFSNGINVSYGGYTYTLTFTLKFPYDRDVAYLAYSYPYTYSDLQEYLLQLSKDQSKTVFTTIRPLCKTVAGNNVYCITVTAPQRPDEVKNKRAVIITARVHPGEAPASWMMKGFIDFLTGHSWPAKKLRDKYIFKLVPMLNPDGVIVGNNRCSLKSCDLNRKYKTTIRKTHPTIWYTKAMIKRTLQECDVAMYCDLHAHAVKHNIFVYGCENGRLLDRPEGQVFPMMLQKNASDKFSFESCEFGIQQMKEGAGRIFMWRMGISNSYTLEASFGGSLLNNRAKTHFKIRDYEQMGHTFCETLLDFSDDDIRNVCQKHFCYYVTQPRKNPNWIFDDRNSAEVEENVLFYDRNSSEVEEKEFHREKALIFTLCTSIAMCMVLLYNVVELS